MSRLVPVLYHGGQARLDSHEMNVLEHVRESFGSAGSSSQVANDSAFATSFSTVSNVESLLMRELATDAFVRQPR